MDAMFGGAAGGGKSEAILAAALQYVTVPGYAALILRRTYADLALPGAIMDRATKWLGPTTASWSSATKTWKFPSGATLSFGYLQHDKDVYRYQSAEFQFIGFDELTQFNLFQFSYMFSRIRRKKGVTVPLRIRSATNPGGVGHQWVKERYVAPRDPSRPFVPSLMDDNPHLDKESYEDALANLDPVTRAQLRSGDWDVLPSGNLFAREWFDIVGEAPNTGDTIRFWDMAATEPKPGTDPDYTVGLKMERAKDGTFYVVDRAKWRKSPAENEAAVRVTAEMDGTGVPQFIEQEPGASGKSIISHFNRNVLPNHTVEGWPITGNKVERASIPSALAENRKVKVVRAEWNADWFAHLEPFPCEGVHDDDVDGFSGAAAVLVDRMPRGAHMATGVDVMPPGM